MVLRRIRQILAVFFLIGITLLFLDFTGTLHAWLGWMPRMQFLPALLALNGVVLAFLVVLTLVFGRIYCSVICPLGVMQDGFAALGMKARKNRYSYSPAKKYLRAGVLAAVAAAWICGIGWFVALLAPYSAYGRIVITTLAPLWRMGNNLLAARAEESGSLDFYQTEMPVAGIAAAAVAVVTLLVLAVLAWRNGRTYCNTVCPVGTVLGFLARYSLFRPVIDTSRCNGCGLCARNCKGACIDSKAHAIDYSRCVSCMNCLGKCHKNAISYSLRRSPAKSGSPASAPVADTGRRTFISIAATMGAAAALRAQGKTVDGGLAVIEDKKVPVRKSRIVPPGATGHRHMENHCTACQLCVAACPNGVLRPSGDLGSLMQPEASYERGYCRPECTRCSEVCPAGAIVKIDRAEKSSIQIGHAVWVRENCIPLTDGVQCGNCARHCPVGAIRMVRVDADDPSSMRIPVVNTERCIGCGACENLCPSRPFSAIYVEGHENHRTI